LIERSKGGRDGLLFSDHLSETSRYMEGHGLATIFLAGACQDEQNETHRARLIELLTRAVKYIVKAQSSQGGWYHTSRVEGHDFDLVSTTAIQFQALEAAENAGVTIPGAAIEDALEYLKLALRKHDAKAPNGGALTETAAALACIYNTSRNVDLRKGDGFPERPDLRSKVLARCQTEIPIGRNIKFGRDELAHYYFAQALFSHGGDAWLTYRTATFDHLQASQHTDGSWPASNGISAGAVYSTSLWCTVLQLARNRHPSLPRTFDRVK
jgi:hypothetical protein